MNMTTFTTLYILAMSLFLALTVVRLLKHSSYENKTQTYAFALFSIWIAIDFSFLGINNVILPVDMSGMTLFILILVAVGISGLLLKPILKTMIAIPQEYLLYPQAFRMFFGLGFMIEAAYGIIPLELGLLDSVFHVTAAFLAITLAVHVAKGCKCTRSIVLVNLFGLLDIVVVVIGITFFVLPELTTTHNVFNVVFFAAPLFIWFHLISLYKVYNERKKV